MQEIVISVRIARSKGSPNSETYLFKAMSETAFVHRQTWKVKLEVCNFQQLYIKVKSRVRLFIFYSYSLNKSKSTFITSVCTCKYLLKDERSLKAIPFYAFKKELDQKAIETYLSN